MARDRMLFVAFLPRSRCRFLTDIYLSEFETAQFRPGCLSSIAGRAMKWRMGRLIFCDPSTRLSSRCCGGFRSTPQTELCGAELRAQKLLLWRYTDRTQEASEREDSDERDRVFWLLGTLAWTPKGTWPDRMVQSSFCTGNATLCLMFFSSNTASLSHACLPSVSQSVPCPVSFCGPGARAFDDGGGRSGGSASAAERERG